MKIIPILLLFIVLAANQGSHADVARPARDSNLNPEGVALQGYDPVSYHTGQPQKGRAEWRTNHNGVRYHFTTADSRARFEADPDRYVPAYGGWCAWAMLEGDKVDIDPLTFKIIDGRSYLFYNGFWGDTLKKWNARSTKEPEPALIEKADAHWARLMAAPE